MDFVHPSIFFVACAAAVWVLPGRIGRWLPPAAAALAIAAVLGMQPGSWARLPYLGLTLGLGRVDALATVFAHVFAIQALIGFVFALHVEDRWQHVAACMYIAGAFGCVFAADYVALFIFWELMSVASTFLIWLQRAPASTRAGIRYFLFHVLGGLLLLAGLLLRHQATGSFAFDAVDPAGARFYDTLILLGVCVNAAVIPLHSWLPDAYPEATVTGAVFMSAFTTKTAVYVLLRAFTGFEILGIMGTLMTLYGVVYATIENNARRILAYHIVSQVGYMVAGVGVGTAMTVDGACAHAYAHILYKGLLFMGAGTLLYAAGTAKLTELGGLFRRLPWAFLWYMVAAVSISGFPLFSGFVSKTMTITGAAEAHHSWLALGMEVAAVGTFLSVGIKLPYFAWFGRPDPGIALKTVPRNMYVAMGMAGLLCFYIGVQPGFLYRLLPHPVDYVPYTAWHVLQALLILGFTGLGFYLLRRKLAPEAGINLDFDWLYRAVGRAVLALARRPVATVDDWWTELYRRAGLRGLMGIAGGSARFDRSAIDGVVDGTALGVRRIGRAAAGAQTGRLQDYLAAAVVLGVLVFAVIWYAGSGVR
ncbi:MAG TPA: Na(+)/H(+) antiporter subunit D [Desulfobacterales bacterium]|nr:Na(+)/H(+) antiporter subunit D [Desulfobacterales bacterium]